MKIYKYEAHDMVPFFSRIIYCAGQTTLAFFVQPGSAAQHYDVTLNCGKGMRKEKIPNYFKMACAKGPGINVKKTKFLIV